MRPKCVKNARNTFGGEHLLDDHAHRGQTLSNKAQAPKRKLRGSLGVNLLVVNYLKLLCLGRP